MAVNVGVNLEPNTKKVEAALARIQAQAKGIDFGGGARSIEKLSRPLGKITGQATEFQKSLEASNARVLAFGASVAVINKLSEAFSALVANTIKVEATFAKINTILGGTEQQLKQFGNGIFDVAKKTATSFDEVSEGALELARQGLSVEESLSRVETSLKLVRVAGIDSQQAVAGLTAAIKGFEGAGLNVAQIADKLAEVDTKFAVSTEDLINGLERASASARVAGVSFDELLGLITTVQERTQRGGAVIGNAFKTIFARLGRSDTLIALQELGISVLDAEGNVRSAVPLFTELATKLDELGLKSARAGEVIQKVAGVRQRDILISLVEDLTSGQSQFAKSLQVSAGAAGALDAKNEKLNQTLEALINNLTTSGQQLASVLGEIGFTDAAKDILKVFSSVLGSLTDLLQGDDVGSRFAQGIIKGIGSVLTGPGLALISAIFIKLFVDLAKFGASSLKSLLGINKAAQQQNALQQSVLQTLLQNENIQREILALEGNKVAQEQLLLKIYNQQAAALARVQKAAATVTPGLFGAGLRGGERGVQPKGRGAGGYIAAEARDVSRGVGGAPASSKVVSIPNFAFGGGKRGTMVANSSEYYVPNYAGGGDAIFNQNMVKSMGLPAGARKINAASGYIPNFVRPRSLERLRGLAKGTGPEAAAAKRELAKREKAKAKQPLIYDPRFAMIVPQAIGPKQLIQGTRAGKKVAFDLVGFEPGVGSRVRNDEQLDSSVKKFALGLANVEAKKLGLPPRPEKIAKLANTGAISALSGTIFETAVSSLLGSGDFDARSQIAAFDFVGSNANQKLKKLFPQLGNATNIEAKIRLGPDTRKSMFDKILKATGNAARGFIPNFAQSPLDEAVAREQAAGIPINQIRINQSGKLRNAQNPMGLAVTNTRDEPTGRVPNFAKAPQQTSREFDGAPGGGGGLFALFALQAAVGGLTNTFDENNKTAQNFGSGLNSLINTLLVLNAVGLGPKGLGGFSKLGKATSSLQKGFSGLTRFLGPVALGLGGLDAVLKAGGAGGIVETFKTLKGAFTGEIFREAKGSAQQRALTSLEQGKFIGTGNEGVMLARTQVRLAELNIAEEKTRAGKTRRGEQKITKDLIQQEQFLERAREQLTEATERLQKKEVERKAIESGALITRERAGIGVRGAFGRRGAAIETGASAAILEKRLELLNAITEEEKTRLDFEIQSIELQKDIDQLKNENLQNLAEEAVKTGKVDLINKDKLISVLKTVDANTDSLELQKKLADELKIEGAEAEELVNIAIENVETLKTEESIRKALFANERALAEATAQRADALEKITQQFNAQERSLGKQTELAQIQRKSQAAALGRELEAGPVSPERRREIEFQQKQLELDGQLANAKKAAADTERAAQEATQRFLETKSDQDAQAVLDADTQAELAQERLTALEKTIEAQTKLNEKLRDQTGFERGLETLNQGILDFGDELGEQIPLKFSDNLGAALKDAVSEAKDLDEALSDAGRNFLEFIRDAFLQQAADQFTNTLFGGGPTGIFGGAGGGGQKNIFSSIGGLFGGGNRNEAAAVGGATSGETEKKSGGIQGFFSGLFGGGKKAALGSSAANPIFVQDVSLISGADPATKAIEELTGQKQGDEEGFFSNIKSGFSDLFGGLKDKLGGIFGGLKDSLGGIFGNLGGMMGGLGGGIGNIFSSLLGGIGGLFGGGGFGLGSLFSFFNAGGPVGRGTDTVPAMLTPGEFVVKKSAVDKYGTDFLSSLNRGMLPMQRFQNGGMVSPVAAEAGSNVLGGGQTTNNTDFTFNIQDGKVSQEGGQASSENQREFAARIRSAVTTVIQEESRTGGSLNYLYKQ